MDRKTEALASLFLPGLAASKALPDRVATSNWYGLACNVPTQTEMERHIRGLKGLGRGHVVIHVGVQGLGHLPPQAKWNPEGGSKP